MYHVVIGFLLMSSVFTSCTENTLLDDDQIILETQAIDKDDSTNRNNNGERSR